MSRQIMQQALDALTICLYHGDGHSDNDQSYLPPRVRDKTRLAIAALEQELAKPEQTTDHYAEVYIRVGDLHVKEVLSQMQFSKARDPIKLLSLVADSCVQTLKELV